MSASAQLQHADGHPKKCKTLLPPKSSPPKLYQLALLLNRNRRRSVRGDNNSVNTSFDKRSEHSNNNPLKAKKGKV